MKSQQQQQQILRSSTGFSLVQVIIVMAIMSVLALAIGQLISSVTGQQAHLTKAFEKQKIFDNLRLTISNTSQCATKLGVSGQTAATLNSTGLPQVTLITDEVISATAPTPDGLLATGNFRFINQVAAGTQRRPNPTGTTNIDYNLIAAMITTVPATDPVQGVSLKKSTGSSGSFDTFKPEAFPIVLMVNPGTNQVDFCYSGGDNNDDVCSDMFGGVYDDAMTIKCAVPRFSVSEAHIERDALPGKFLVQESMSIFSKAANAPATLTFQDGVVGGSPATVTSASANNALVSYSAVTGLTMAPAGATPAVNMMLTPTAVNFTGFTDGVRISGATVGPSLSITKTGGGNAVLAVTKTGGGTAAITVDAGATNPALNVTGTAFFQGAGGTAPNTVTIAGGQVNASSDRRLKTDIHVITDALDKISQIQGVTFVQKADPDHIQRIGVIAQDVQQVFPEAIAIDKSGYLSVNYSGLIGPVIEAVKELKAQKDDEIRELRQELLALKHEMATLKRRSAFDKKK